MITHTHTRTHAHTHEHTHTRMHALTHTRTLARTHILYLTISTLIFIPRHIYLRHLQQWFRSTIFGTMTCLWSRVKNKFNVKGLWDKPNNRCSSAADGLAKRFIRFFVVWLYYRYLVWAMLKKDKFSLYIIVYFLSELAYFCLLILTSKIEHDFWIYAFFKKFKINPTLLLKLTIILTLIIVLTINLTLFITLNIITLKFIIVHNLICLNLKE